MDMTTQAITVKLVLDADDFDRLCENSGKASGIAAGKNRWRFKDAGDGAPPVLPWRYVYWLGRNYANVLLARSFLQAWGEDFQVASDEAGPDYGWVIFTDWASPSWAEADDPECE